MSRLVVDGFGGPGGWAEGLRSLGIAEVGIEIDPWACATRGVAGHRTIRADITTYPTAPFLGRIWGAVFSPPCTDYSRAGKRAGRSGDTGKLVEEVPRWVGDLRPEWVVCEQVPDVLPIWREFAHLFARWGYSTWCGILNAADYGVPQTRERAILMASRTLCVQPPAATHDRRPHPVMFGADLLPWVTMADALGWTGLLRTSANTELAGGHRQLYERAVDRPAPVVVANADRWKLNPGATNTQPNRRRYELDEPTPTVAFDHDANSWAWERPATTVCATDRVDREGGESQFERDAIKLTVADALILQGFRADYPLRGTKTKQFEQVGNAVPPPLAARIVAAAAGLCPRCYR